MKLCMDCKHYGGVKASNGKYICKNINTAASVDGIVVCRDAVDAHGRWNSNRLVAACGALVGGQIRRLTLNAVCVF